MPSSDSHDHDLGLAHDLPLLERRAALGLVAAAGAAAWLWGSSPIRAAAAACVADPRETAGPFPADGTNMARGPTSNALASKAVVRSDIRSSFVGGSNATAVGVPVRMTLTLVDAGAGCRPLAGHVVYVWHCDAEGRYSLYDLPQESWLRGVQVTDAGGRVSFTTVFPGYYPGRYPHIHFEVFRNLASATNGRNGLLVGQLAMPREPSAAVYATRDYGNSAAAFAGSSIQADGIFRDNLPAQIAQQTLAMSGSPAAGYSATGTVGLLTG